MVASAQASGLMTGGTVEVWSGGSGGVSSEYGDTRQRVGQTFLSGLKIPNSF